MLLTLLIGVFSSHSVFAATAVASVSQNSVTKDEVFLLRVATNEKVSSGALDLTPLQKDFYVSTPRFGSSMRIVNGSFRSESGFLWRQVITTGMDNTGTAAALCLANGILPLPHFD